jgi:transcriptional regulator with XRE-family HTH domain
MPFSNSRLILVLLAKRWKPADLARESGIGEDQIGRYIKGERKPRDAAPLARALEVSTDYLLENDNRFENLPAERAVALLCLERLGRDENIEPSLQSRLKDLAYTLTDPPVSLRDWRRLREVLLLTGHGGSPVGPRPGLHVGRRARQRPVQ